MFSYSCLSLTQRPLFLFDSCSADLRYPRTTINLFIFGQFSYFAVCDTGIYSVSTCFSDDFIRSAVLLLLFLEMRDGALLGS